MNSQQSNLLLIVGAGLSVVVFTAYCYWKDYQRHNIMPKKWRCVGKLAPINIFPLKSCAPLQIDPTQEVTCEILAARIQNIYDRSLMLIDNENCMITARVYPQMVLVKSKVIATNRLQFFRDDQDDLGPLEVDFTALMSDSPGDIVHTNVHSVSVDVFLCGPKYDKWFSQAILQQDMGLKLAYYHYKEPVKNIQTRLLKEPFLRQFDTGTLNDATSYHLINLSSLDDLNKHTNQPVAALQFRANFEVIMHEPVAYAEDNWQWLKIGEEAIFRVVAPCGRCILPNINPTTGARDSNREPLTVLNKIRKWKKYPAPIFGIHLGIRQPGKIKANDVVYIQDS